MKKNSISYKAMTQSGQQKLLQIKGSEPQDPFITPFKEKYPEVYKKGIELSKRTIEEEKTKCKNQQH